MSTRKPDIKDKTGLDEIVSNLVEKGRAHFMHLGIFQVVERKGRQRYDVKKRKMVPYPAYRTIKFTPSKPLREMLNKKRK